jgi:hypothetical protein
MAIQKRNLMCPACIANTAAMVAGVSSTGGILAVCIGKFGKLFSVNGFVWFHKLKEKSYAWK